MEEAQGKKTVMGPQVSQESSRGSSSELAGIGSRRRNKVIFI